MYEMKPLSKSAIIFVVLTICMPVRSEILIYKKTTKCLTAYEGDEFWEVEDEINRGYLVLDVTADPNGEVTGIHSAEQIEYVRRGRNKWYWQQEHSFEFSGIEIEKGFLWVFMEKDTSDIEGGIFVMTGKAKDSRIGLGKDEPRGIAKRIKGDILVDWIIGDGVLQICTVTLRLQSKFTKRANDENEGDQDFEYAVFDIVKAYLNDRGYQHLT